MTKLFTKEKVNTGRQIELDIAKGLAILFMVLVHVNEVYQNPSLNDTMYPRIIEFLGSPPAAPIFMLLLGLGLVYSKHNDAKYLLKRGCFLFILGYILNFFRDFIPYNLLAIMESDPEYKIEAWNSLWGIDILPFAGLTFIFFGIIKKYKIKDKYLPLIWCCFATLNILLRHNSTGSGFTDSIFGLIWATDDYSWFPFLTWIAYPIFGYLFGQLLIRCTNKELLYKKCFLYSGIALIPLTLYAYVNEVDFGAFGALYQESYYSHDIMGNIILGTFAIFWIGLIYFITKYIPQKFYNHFARWSKNATNIYCSHWILLGFSMLIFETEIYNPPMIMFITIILFILSDFISARISKLTKKTYSLPIKEDNSSLAA